MNAAAPAPENGLTKSVDVDVVIATRKAYADGLNAAAVAMREAGKHGDVTLIIPAIGRRNRTFYWPGQEAVDEMVRRYDAAAWWRLLKDSGLYSFLDATGREAWKKNLDEGEHPELTEENLRSTFGMLYEQRGEMFERGVIALFRSLNWDYKTNAPCLFGKRLVVERAVEGQGFDFATFRFGNELDDLIRVMSILDDKPEPDSAGPQGAWQKLRAVGWPRKTKDAQLDGYVSVRGFKNGNAHLTFLRLDLVEKMNKILARHYPNALPPKKD